MRASALLSWQLSALYLFYLSQCILQLALFGACSLQLRALRLLLQKLDGDVAHQKNRAEPHEVLSYRDDCAEEHEAAYGSQEKNYGVKEQLCGLHNTHPKCYREEASRVASSL